MLLGGRFTFAVANSGAARVIGLKLTDGTNILYNVEGENVKAPINATTSFSIMVPPTNSGAFGNAIDSFITYGGPIIFMAGDVFSSSTPALAALDAYSAIFLRVMLWFEK